MEQFDRLICHVPVNVLPKTSSSGGTSSFGVLVLVMDNLFGSMPCNFAVDPGSTDKLYARGHCHRAICFNGNALPAGERTDPESRRLDWRSILSAQ